MSKVGFLRPPLSFNKLGRRGRTITGGYPETAVGPWAERVIRKHSSWDYPMPFLARSIHIHEHAHNKSLSPKSRRKDAVHSHMSWEAVLHPGHSPSWVKSEGGGCGQASSLPPLCSALPSSFVHNLSSRIYMIALNPMAFVPGLPYVLAAILQSSESSRMARPSSCCDY